MKFSFHFWNSNDTPEGTGPLGMSFKGTRYYSEYYTLLVFRAIIISLLLELSSRSLHFTGMETTLSVKGELSPYLITAVRLDRLYAPGIF